MDGLVPFMTSSNFALMTLFGLLGYFAILIVELFLDATSATRSGLFLFRCCIAVFFGLAYCVRFATLFSADIVFMGLSSIFILTSAVTTICVNDLLKKYQEKFNYKYAAWLLILIPMLTMFAGQFSIIRGINTFFFLSIFWEIMTRNPQIFTKVKYFDTFIFGTAFLGLII